MKTKTEKQVETFDEAAKCHVLSVHYDVINKVGSFVLADGHCSDMYGAIRIFTRIDPDVQRIIDGNTEWRKVDGKWESYRLPPNPDNEFGDWNAKDYFRIHELLSTKGSE